MTKPKTRITITELKPPIKRKIGGWVEETYDAGFTFHGITWLRVKDGMGGRGDREDWVADLEGVCVSVHDYEWDPKRRWGFVFYGSFEKALLGKLRKGAADAMHDILTLSHRIARLRQGAAAIEACLAVARKRKRKRKTS